MANSFSTNLIPSIIAAARDVLKPKAAMLSIMNTDFDSAGAKLGSTVTVPIPTRSIGVEDVVPGVTPSAPTATLASTTPLVIDQFKRSKPFALTVEESKNYDITTTIQRQIEQAVVDVVGAMSTYAWSFANEIGTSVGAAGTAMYASNTEIMADVDLALNNQLVSELGRMMFISNTDRKDLLKTDDARHFNLAGTSDIRTSGVLGSWYDIDVSRDSYASSHEQGSVITGSAVVTVGAHVQGATSIACNTGSGGAILFKVGDQVIIDGNSYAVATAVTQGTASTAFTLVIHDGLIAAISGGDVLSQSTGFAAGAGTTYRTGLAGDFSGISMVNRGTDMSQETLGRKIPIVDPDTGVTLSLNYYPEYEQGAWEITALYGAKVTDPRKLVRVLSA